MRLNLQILLLLLLPALALAQSSSLFFSAPFTEVTAGTTKAVEYKSSHLSSAARILLRRGPSPNLHNVATLTKNATGGTYDWLVSPSLAPGSDYALEIEQDGETNYLGGITIVNPSYASSSHSTKVKTHSKDAHSATKTAWSTSSAVSPERTAYESAAVYGTGAIPVATGSPYTGASNSSVPGGYNAPSQPARTGSAGGLATSGTEARKCGLVGLSAVFGVVAWAVLA